MRTVVRIGKMQGPRNRLPLCEGEVDFICEVPNHICYQVLISQVSYRYLIDRLPLCEGEVDFICEVSNLICYQVLISLINS